MLTCPNPSCRKALPDLTRTCPSCQADLSLLVDYAGELGSALDRARALTRAGELAKAVWAYLEVLEVDPENADARRQVGQVAAAVRQFDRVAPGRRWQARLLRAEAAAGERAWSAGWVQFLVVLLAVAAALLVGYQWGISAR
jgi:hypothetical protein